jgi:threonine synthase
MASAASVAGMLQLADAGELPRGATVVCTLTGHGLKEPDWAIAGAGKPDVLPVDVAAVAAKLGLR